VLRGAPSSHTVLAAAAKYFLIEKLSGAARDAARQRAALGDAIAHQPAFVVAWAGEPDAWKLTLSLDVSPINEGVQVDRALQKLDPVVVDALFIERMMPGAKVETMVGAEDALAAKADAVVLLRALTIEQINHIADIGAVLPAGSTAFTPRVPPGLVSFVVDQDEDLV
jgi:hypothetical protein